MTRGQRSSGPRLNTEKKLTAFFLGVKHSLYKNKITGALECLGTVPSIMSGTKHIICTFASLHHQVS